MRSAWIILKNYIEDLDDHDCAVRWNPETQEVQVKNVDMKTEWETIPNDESIFGKITDEEMAKRLAFYKLRYCPNNISWMQTKGIQERLRQRLCSLL